MVRFAAAVILLAISACVSAEDQLANSDTLCQSYGFSPGADAYVECVQREVHASARYKAGWDARQRRQARAMGR
jgi:hypothetical protein